MKISGAAKPGKATFRRGLAPSPCPCPVPPCIQHVEGWFTVAVFVVSLRLLQLSRRYLGRQLRVWLNGFQKCENILKERDRSMPSVQVCYCGESSSYHSLQLPTVTYLNFESGSWGSGKRKSPSGDRDEAPIGVFVTQKLYALLLTLYTFWRHTVKYVGGGHIPVRPNGGMTQMGQW